MDKDIQLGSVGDLDIALAGGKATVSVKVAVPVAALDVGASVSVDAIVLLDKLQAAIAKALPASAQPIEAAVWAVIENAIKAI